jgi:hypothetical protein
MWPAEFLKPPIRQMAMSGMVLKSLALIWQFARRILAAFEMAPSFFRHFCFFESSLPHLHDTSHARKLRPLLSVSMSADVRCRTEKCAAIA